VRRDDGGAVSANRPPNHGVGSEPTTHGSSPAWNPPVEGATETVNAPRAIWIASYPRSGNTWSRLALLSLKRDGAQIELRDVIGFGRMTVSREQIDDWLQIDSSDLTAAELDALRPDMHAAYFSAAEEPILCKVHDAWGLTMTGRAIFPRELTLATIYLVRDPRDVAVSWAKFTGTSTAEAIAFLGNRNSSLSPLRERLNAQIPQRLGSWSQHLSSWIAESDLAPLVIRYEDMVADPAAALSAMARHIGWTPDARAVAGAVAATRFSRLAEIEAARGFGEKPRSAERFFRAGRSGGWRELLTVEQIARIEHDHRDWMIHFGYL
jgi:aryl sulfotransferase